MRKGKESIIPGGFRSFEIVQEAPLWRVRGWQAGEEAKGVARGEVKTEPGARRG